MATQPPSQTALTLEPIGQDPVVFWGPPSQLRGMVRVRNASSEKVKMRGLPLEADTIRGPAGEPVASVSVAARLLPNSHASLPATLALDPATPAGSYEGYIAFGTSRQPVRLLVAEHVDLRVHPRQAFILTDGVLEFEREFVFENAGNVPVSLGGECLVPLVDTLETRTALRHGLEQACRKESSSDPLKAVLCAWSDQQVGPVSIRREPVVLKPGEIRPVRVTFVLPQDIRGFRKYVMHLVVYTAALRVEVVTGKIDRAVAS